MIRLFQSPTYHLALYGCSRVSTSDHNARVSNANSRNVTQKKILYPMRSVANAITESERFVRDEAEDDPFDELPLGVGRGIPFEPVIIAETTPPEPE